MGGGQLLTTPSALAPSSSEDKSPRSERLDRSGSPVPDQSSSISQAQIYFRDAPPVSLPCGACDGDTHLAPPPVSH